MADERDKHRRARTHADDTDRANAGRDHRRRDTPRGGVPVEVDPEETPPPQLPPAPDADTTTGRIDRLELGMKSFEAGFGEVWSARHTAERLEGLEKAVARIEQSIVEFIKPTVTAVKQEIESMQRSRATELASSVANQARVQLFWDEQWPNAIKQLDGLDTRLDGLGTRLGRIEKTQDDQGRDIRAMTSQIASVGAVGNSLDVRVTALERRNADAALVATTNRRWFTVIVSGVSASIAIVITHVKDIIGYFRGH